MNKIKQVNLYNEFLSSLDLSDPMSIKFYDLVVKVDRSINNQNKTLFLISLFCNVYYYLYGNRKNQLKRRINFKPKIRCGNFVIFTYDKNKTMLLLEKLVHYFNTDASNLLPITGSILDDLNNMDIHTNSN